MFGWSADRLVQDAHGVTVEIGERNGSGRMTLRGEFAVGCDGSHSIVRDQAGITQTLSDHDRLMVLLVFKSAKLHELLKRYPGKSFYNVLHPDLKGYWKFFGRVDLGTTWFFHAPVPPGTTKDNFDFKRLVCMKRLAPSSTSPSITSASGICASQRPTTIARVACSWPATPRTATRPMAATASTPASRTRAISAGSLRRRLQGWGGERLLDSYDAERRPVFESTARDFIEKSIETDRAFVRDLRSGSATLPPSTPAGRDAPPARAPRSTPSSRTIAAHRSSSARRAPRPTPRARTPSRRSPDIISRRKCCRPAATCSRSLGQVSASSRSMRRTRPSQRSCRQLKPIKIPLKIIRDTFADKRTAYEAKLILVRPDHFVAWCANEAPADARAILRKAIGSD